MTRIWESRLRVVLQPQLCQSLGSPRKASCGAGYPAGIWGTSLHCSNPRDGWPESLLSRSGPQMIQTRGWGFLREGKQEKTMPCQLQKQPEN